MSRFLSLQSGAKSTQIFDQFICMGPIEDWGKMSIEALLIKGRSDSGWLEKFDSVQKRVTFSEKR